MSQPLDLETFLKQHPSTEPSELVRKLDTLGLDPTSPLYSKAKHIICGIDGLHTLHNGLTLEDTETIQHWVLSLLDVDEYKTMARVSFAAWATPERLGQDGVPHITQANIEMGSQILRLSREMGVQSLRLLDLGAGALGTVAHIVDQLNLSGDRYTISVDAVEFVPVLLEKAHERGEKLRAQYPNVTINIIDSEMLRFTREQAPPGYHFTTISYAIHHLHPTEQQALIEQIYRLLVPNGALFIADPQEGKSAFNREMLLRTEPEGVFAIFSSPTEVIQRLKKAGFSDCMILLEDPVGYAGFLVYGIKRETEWH